MIKRMKQAVLALLLCLPVLPLAAQQQPEQAQELSDTVYVFRFVSGNDMFYVPFRDNNPELNRLYSTLKYHIDCLSAGQMYINVSSYTARGNKSASAERMGYLRNSRVKSELITRMGLTEGMFVTDKVISPTYGRDSLRNVVIVTFPASVEKVEQIAGPEAAERVRSYNKETYGDPEAKLRAAEQARLAAERAERERPAAEKARREQNTATVSSNTASLASSDLQSEDLEYKDFQSAISLRANLLRWATLTPDLGIEWHINRNFSILVNGSWTSWSWNDKDRRYALWKLSPEVRYYIGKEKRGFLGAMYHIGEFNYKLGDTGKQGDYQGGSITGGYLLQLNRALALDLHTALGYTRADYDKYTVTDGIRVRTGSKTKNYWGINQLGVTLVWTFFK